MAMLPIDDKCIDIFKLIKTQKKYRYLIMKIQNQKVHIDKLGARHQNWINFINELNPLEPRYSLFDADINHIDGDNSNSMIFFSWVPDSSKVKMKVIYGAFRSHVKNQIDNSMKQFQASSIQDCSYEEVIQRLSK